VSSSFWRGSGLATEHGEERYVVFDNGAVTAITDQRDLCRLAFKTHLLISRLATPDRICSAPVGWPREPRSGQLLRSGCTNTLSC